MVINVHAAVLSQKSSIYLVISGRINLREEKFLVTIIFTSKKLTTTPKSAEKLWQEVHNTCPSVTYIHVLLSRNSYWWPVALCQCVSKVNYELKSVVLYCTCYTTSHQLWCWQLCLVHYSNVNAETKIKEDLMLSEKGKKMKVLALNKSISKLSIII